MSTKSTALFSTPKETAHPERFSSGLCTSFLPTGQEKVFVKDIPEHQLQVIVQPFSVTTDLPILYKWMSQEYAGPLLTRSRPPQELEESYTSMIASDFAQPFMVFVNNVPICQMDIYKARQDVLSLSYPVRPGDYRLHLVVAPLTIQTNMVLILKTCLEHFFSFPEVGRIIVNVEEEDGYNAGLFKSVGFRNLHDLRSIYKASSLYACTSSHFHQAQADAR